MKAKPQPGQTLFQFPNGKSFKGRDLNRILSEVTGPLTEGTESVVRAHSFRAAIATEMGIRGFTDQEIQAQG